MVGPYTYKSACVLKEVKLAIKHEIPIVQVIGYKGGVYKAVPNAGTLYEGNWENLKMLLDPGSEPINPVVVHSEGKKDSSGNLRHGSWRAAGLFFIFSPLLYSFGGDPSNPAPITLAYWMFALLGGVIMLSGSSKRGSAICLFLGLLLSVLKIIAEVDRGIRPVLVTFCLLICVIGIAVVLGSKANKQQ
jgi:hypothetical protein